MTMMSRIMPPNAATSIIHHCSSCLAVGFNSGTAYVVACVNTKLTLSLVGKIIFNEELTGKDFPMFSDNQDIKIIRYNTGTQILFKFTFYVMN